MNNTGIVRLVRVAGRFVLPKEVREQLGVEAGVQIEVFADGEDIVIRPYRQACLLCDGKDGIKEYRGKYVCESCRRAIETWRG